MYIEKLFYKTLLTNTTDKDTYIVPDGKTIYLSELGGDAAFIPSTMICILFDDVVIFSTHGSAKRTSTQELIGDGVKKLEISVSNTSLETETMGGYYKARLL